MRNFQIVEGQIEVTHEEVEHLKKYVEKQQGRICWGFWRTAVENGDEEIIWLFYMVRGHIIGTLLKDIDDGRQKYSQMTKKQLIAEMKKNDMWKGNSHLSKKDIINELRGVFGDYA